MADMLTNAELEPIMTADGMKESNLGLLAYENISGLIMLREQVLGRIVLQGF
jgi:hypothetical protein